MFTRRLVSRPRPLRCTTRPISSSAVLAQPIDKLTVYGAGLMGSGIAQVAAVHGLRVVLSDVDDEACQNGLSIIKKSMARVAKKAHPDSDDRQRQMIEDVLSKVKLSTDQKLAVQDADLVVEAIVEKLPAKQELFKALDKLAPPHTIFASNTSSLKVQDIAEATSPARQKRFAGLHFFNPVPQMKLVEVIRTTETDDDVTQSLTDFVKRLEKYPAKCKDTPSFIVNRLLVPYMFSAMEMAERGDATPQDIDTAMKLGAGYPMGPFELADYVGLDTYLHITKVLQDKTTETGAIGEDGKKVVKTLEELVRQGKLGRKSGEGFYKY